ncbi:hypothetical protein QAD02_013428 [Eretmocerus hayati]|uniref:Uncharacterized protein n=1 Tax=Eretmocerus hayati TaxID=131215 RepID=A0ACC2P3J1_9HYME|nr:hypothetical protein QAD02_013428 [Eretmocerus hayati]
MIAQSANVAGPCINQSNVRVVNARETCTYCDKIGHDVDHCLKKRDDERLCQYYGLRRHELQRCTKFTEDMNRKSVYINHRPYRGRGGYRGRGRGGRFYSDNRQIGDASDHYNSNSNTANSSSTNNQVPNETVSERPAAQLQGQSSASESLIRRSPAAVLRRRAHR